MTEGNVTSDNASTRRSFLKGGAALAAPLAVALPAAVMADERLNLRLMRLEDEAAIRELHQIWLRQINTGAVTAFDQAVHSIAADHSGQLDAIEIAANGTSAAGRFHCAVEIETAIAQDCTLARMAHAQGGGFVRRTDRRVLNVEYVKTSGAWAIAKVEFASV
jgi:hypothetical protein